MSTTPPISSPWSRSAWTPRRRGQPAADPRPLHQHDTTTLQLTGRITETGAISIGVAACGWASFPRLWRACPTPSPFLHFDEPAGAAPFANDAGLGDATCGGSACPTAGADGAWGTALSFGGEYYSADDYLFADGVGPPSAARRRFRSGPGPMPVTTPATAHCWLSTPPQAACATRLCTIATPSSTWMANGGSAVGPPTEERWAYVMVTIDTDGHRRGLPRWRAEGYFHHPVPAQPDGRFSIGQEWDGDTPSQFFSGQIDEVAIYSRALSATEAYGVYADATLSASGQGVASAAWSYNLPDTLTVSPSSTCGHLQPVRQRRPPPGIGRSGRARSSTRPRPVKLTVAEKEETYDVAGLHPFIVKTTYTCLARDFNLVAASEAHPSYDFDCPCDTLAPVSTVITDTFYHEVSPWYGRSSATRPASTSASPRAPCRARPPRTSCRPVTPTVAVPTRWPPWTGPAVIPVVYSVVLTPDHQAILTQPAVRN